MPKDFYKTSLKLGLKCHSYCSRYGTGTGTIGITKPAIFSSLFKSKLVLKIVFFFLHTCTLNKIKVFILILISYIH